MSENSALPRILHVFTSEQSAADLAAQAVLQAQSQSQKDVSSLILSRDNAAESLKAIFAADNITTWPGIPESKS
ncbi:MAG: hypothetical protein ACAI35_00400 [Candidatus Methylacidiphilales bacterium]|nr:hypothetical protein [Candidatus Methylacidiphilales bacterium]